MEEDPWRKIHRLRTYETAELHLESTLVREVGGGEEETESSLPTSAKDGNAGLFRRTP